MRFQNCSKPISSICATLNFAPASAYSLQSVAMACGAGLSVSSEPEAKSFSVNSRALTCEMLFELLQNFRVARRRRRRSQIQRVGNEAGQQQPGDGARQFHAMPEKTVGHDRAGGADRFVAEQNRLLRGQRADAVMVNDLNDFHLVRALHGLRKFVVIHENQLARDRFQKIRLGQNADGLAGAVQHRKRQVAGRHGLVAHGGERRVFAEAEKLLVQNVAHGDGGAAERRGRRRVVRRGDDADVFFARGLDGFRLHGDAAGDDEHAHAFADGDVLDVRSGRRR